MTNHYRYLLFYKPYGVLSQFTKDTPTRSTLKDYISIPDVYPVGRLDWDSEGLLLLTNYGQLQYRLLNPRFGHKRSYWVQVERIPDATALKKLEEGVAIQDYRTRPAKVQLLSQEPIVPDREPPIRFRKNVPTAWLEMTLTEGKNRQVRRMTAAVGFPTLRLVRFAIAHLHLDGLQPGQWRDLTSNELKLLHNLTSQANPSSRQKGLIT
ncbi:MAG: pseudouridine synthase [Fischerella sp.]|jgi:23S rRNA pseudouridine2457 synthase|uniref:pseudouridine synthase n=1 Tax=Fischerella sp. TaxID=1191 RepID=UPI0017981D71|nr:pseudouridine synthase [Fischerella sp.]NWF58924.1 pseudouridine synthase [Fischerella sp.]